MKKLKVLGSILLCVIFIFNITACTQEPSVVDTDSDVSESQDVSEILDNSDNPDNWDDSDNSDNAEIANNSQTGSEYLNYASALQHALYLYDANMCGEEVGDKSGLNWRDACHTYDIYEYDGAQIDLTGGFHDAGDHVKFGLPAAFSAIMLEYAYYEFKDAFTETGTEAHLVNILGHFNEYFRKLSIYNIDGEIETFVYQVGEGGGDHDHGYWGPPEVQPQEYKVGERTALFTSPENPCADIVAATAIALTLHYVNFGDEQSLLNAIDLFEYMRNNDKKVSEVEEYTRWSDDANPNDPWDYISLAALWLNEATGTEDYSDMINPRGSRKKYTSWPTNWDGVWALVNIMNEEWSIVRDNNCSYNRGDEYRFIMEWGSARLNASLQFVGLVYDKHNGTTDFTEWAKGQMDIIFGNNVNNQAYVVGYNYRDDIKYPLYPHHRASDGYDEFPGEPWNHEVDDNVPYTRPQKHVLVGALVGGPETEDLVYHDCINNYVGNEVALDYSAGFIGALAGLYLAYGRDNGDTIIDPPSLIDTGVSDKYALS